MTLQLHKHGFLLGDFLTEPVREQYGALIETQVKQLSDVIETTTKALTQIDNDRGLLPQGKVERRNKVILSSLKEIAQQSTDRRRMLDRDLENTRDGLPTKIPNPLPSEIDPVIHESRLREIRSNLAELSEPDRIAELRKAAATASEKNRDVVLAVLGASSIKHLVPELEVEKAKQSYLEVAFAEKFQRVETVEQGMRDFLYNIRMARNAIALAAGTKPSGLPPFDDPIGNRAAS